ncbi:MAG: response regulator [Deltaproteobacteria bacterium]
MNETLLRTGSRVAIVGGGPAGAAAAAALMSTARRIGKIVEVTLYHASSCADELTEPMAIDEATCVRLATLGMGIPQGYLTSFEGIVLHGGTSSSPAHELRRRWSIVTPGAPAAAFRRLMRGVASGLGARLVPFPASPLERQGTGSQEPIRIRARGLVQLADLAIVATGVRSPHSTDILGGAGPRLRLGASMWLRGHRPFPPHFTSRAHVHARGGSWLTALPIGARIFVTIGDTGGRREQPFELVMRLQRDGLLPNDLSIERAWARLFPVGPSRSPTLAVGEAAGPLWLPTAFGNAVAHGLRLAEDALVLPRQPAPAKRQRRRSSASTSEWRDRSKVASRLELSDLGKPRGATLATWLLMGDDGPPPASPSILPVRGLWQRLGRGLRRLRRRLEGERRALARAAGGQLVYLVDDDPATCFALASWLGERGIFVRTFTDELSVAACAARERPAAILLDVVLRRIDGPTLLGWLSRDPSTAGIPVVLISGTGSLVPRATKPYAFLEKPLNPAALLDLLGPLLPSTPARASALGA